jgi:hypothetical protein
MDFRVASNFASFRAAGFSDSPGRPVFLTSPSQRFIGSCIVPFSLSCWFRVSPAPASSGLASCASPGRPVLRVLWPRRVTASTGCPASSVVWLCQRWIFELPRISHPSALPVSVIRRVAPFSSLPPRNAFDPGFRFPFFLHLRLCRRRSFESPRISHPSAVPIDRSPGRPELRSLGIAFDPFFGSPRLADRPAPAGGLPSRPGRRTLQLCQRRVFESPRTSFPWHPQR